MQDFLSSNKGINSEQEDNARTAMSAITGYANLCAASRMCNFPPGTVGMGILRPLCP